MATGNTGATFAMRFGLRLDLPMLFEHAQRSVVNATSAQASQL